MIGYSWRTLAGISACLTLIAALSACGSTTPAPTEPPGDQATADAPPPVTLPEGFPVTIPTVTQPAPTVTPTASAASEVQPVAGSNTGGQSSQSKPASARPAPCNIGGGEEVYLLVEGQRRHIIDLDTFTNLGYKPADIKDCGASSSLPEGGPITRLVKSPTEDAVYWMENGVRRHVPDMTTFTAMSFQVGDISLLPGSIVALWPLGPELAKIADTVYKTITIRGYTIRLWHPVQGHGMFDFATISANKQPDIRVENFESIGSLPAEDITGDGYPDVEFLTRGIGSAHCCWGTTVYSLGPSPIKVLDFYSPAYYGSDAGRGDFRDLDGDGVYEFTTLDPLLKNISCSQPRVNTVLAYDAGAQRYVGASPRFASYFDDQIAQLNATTQPGGVCEIYPLVAQLLYIGRADDAKAAYDRLHVDPDVSGGWDDLVSGVQQGRYYVAP